MKHLLFAIALACPVGIVSAGEASPPADDRRADGAGLDPVGYEALRVEGWKLFVSDRLREQNAAATESAIGLLGEQLKTIGTIVPLEALAKLRAVPLWFSPVYPGIPPRAEYHPNIKWLVEHGRNPLMAKGVEFTNIDIFAKEVRRMPMLALHELAHAYHDRLLGFDNADIKAAYQHAVDNKSYEAVRRSNGRTERAYALTNPQEYFAETTEAFFGENDFYPFNRAELKAHDPQMERLLEHLWGAAPATR